MEQLDFLSRNCAYVIDRALTLWTGERDQWSAGKQLFAQRICFRAVHTLRYQFIMPTVRHVATFTRVSLKQVHYSYLTRDKVAFIRNKRPMSLDHLLVLPDHFYVSFTLGRACEIQADFQYCPCWTRNLGTDKSFQKLHKYTFSITQGRNRAYFSLCGQWFLRYRLIFKLVMSGR